MDEVFRGAGIAANDLVFFDEMNFEAEFIFSRVVFEVPVQAVSLFHQHGPASGSAGPQEAQHLAEVGSARDTGRFYIDELFENMHAVLSGVRTQQIELGVN